MRRIYNNSVVQAAADDRWEYEADEYFVVCSEYMNCDGAMTAAEYVFRDLRSTYDDDRFFLVRQPDQTWVVVHRPPVSITKDVIGADSVREMCDRLGSIYLDRDEDEDGCDCDAERLVDLLGSAPETFLKAAEGGEMRVTWRAWVTAETPEGAVESAIKDLSEHREHHRFETQYRGFRESVIQASRFTLSP